MTILEELASLTSPTLADRVAEHRQGSRTADDDIGVRGPAAAFDNRPSWDNWAKKEPPFSKKTHYFRKK
jgi:hypothetical protein